MELKIEINGKFIIIKEDDNSAATITINNNKVIHLTQITIIEAINKHLLENAIDSATNKSVSLLG